MTRVVRQLTQAGYPKSTPVAVVYRVGWPDEKVIRGTLTDIAKKVREAKITLQALIMVGNVVDPDINRTGRDDDGQVAVSHLYSQDYTHLYRKGRLPRPRSARPAKPPEQDAAIASRKE